MFLSVKQRSFLCYSAVLLIGYVIGGLDTSSWHNIGSVMSSSTSSSSSRSIFTSMRSSSSSSSSTNVSTASKRFLIDEAEQKEEGEKGEEEEGPEGEEEEAGWNKLSSTIVCIVLFLIAMTIMFEEMKESLEHHSDREMEPILEKMFAELTILGFLSMFSFILSKTGVFEFLGDMVFGSGEELTEIFEFVHMVIFFIMVLFVVQIMILLKAAMAVQEQWEDMDIYARTTLLKQKNSNGNGDEVIQLKGSIDAGQLQAYTDELAQEQGEDDSYSTVIKRITPLKVFHFIFPFFNRGTKLNHHGYFDLREEFLKDRDTKPPYKIADEQLGDQFNFGKYLGATLVETLEHVTDVSVYTWGIFALLTIGYYLIMVIVQGNMTILTWLWPTFGWMVYIGNSIFEAHLLVLRNKLHAPPKPATGDNNVATETDGLLSNDPHPSSLPTWCKTDMNKYMKARNRLVSFFLGSDVNVHPQQSLYWFDRVGPRVYMHILQINIIYTGLYVALLMLSFLKHIYEEQPLPIFFFYLIYSTLPIYGLVSSKERVVATLTQVRCVGIYRHPQHIANVMRQTKTMDVVRTFLVVSKLHKFAKVADAKEITTKKGPQPSYKTLFDAYEIKEIGKTFDKFDRDGSGNIDHQEFFDLMKNIDSTIEDERLRRMVASLDRDGDGSVDKEEFLQWYGEQMIAADANNDGEKQSVRERAKDIFDLFDDDGNGNLSLSEFKAKLDVFGDFTLDEIGELVTELDHDKSNQISVDEFEELIKRYEPRDIRKELKRSSRKKHLTSEVKGKRKEKKRLQR